jgi:hypothetical protein
MRALEPIAGLVAIIAVGAYLWGHHYIAAILAWVVFPVFIVAHFMLKKRKVR